MKLYYVRLDGKKLEFSPYLELTVEKARGEVFVSNKDLDIKTHGAIIEDCIVDLPRQINFLNENAKRDPDTMTNYEKDLREAFLSLLT